MGSPCVSGPARLPGRPAAAAAHALFHTLHRSRRTGRALRLYSNLSKSRESLANIVVAPGSLNPARCHRHESGHARGNHGRHGIQPRARAADPLFHALRGSSTARRLHSVRSSHRAPDADNQPLSLSKYGRSVLRAGLLCFIDAWEQSACRHSLHLLYVRRARSLSSDCCYYPCLWGGSAGATAFLLRRFNLPLGERRPSRYPQSHSCQA
jgi:hypothetical protein